MNAIDRKVASSRQRLCDFEAEFECNNRVDKECLFLLYDCIN